LKRITQRQSTRDSTDHVARGGCSQKYIAEIDKDICRACLASTPPSLQSDAEVTVPKYLVDASAPGVIGLRWRSFSQLFPGKHSAPKADVKLVKACPSGQIGGQLLFIFPEWPVSKAAEAVTPNPEKH
jgi:hypothetical protein